MTHCIIQAATCSSHIIHPFAQMGSVGENYRCPLCGRVGMGGYALDGGPGRPVCDQGPHNCITLLTDGGPQGQFETFGRHLFNKLVQLHPNAPWNTWPPGLTDIIAKFSDVREVRMYAVIVS